MLYISANVGDYYTEKWLSWNPSAWFMSFSLPLCLYPIRITQNYSSDISMADQDTYITPIHTGAPLKLLVLPSGCWCSAEQSESILTRGTVRKINSVSSSSVQQKLGAHLEVGCISPIVSVILIFGSEKIYKMVSWMLRSIPSWLQLKIGYFLGEYWTVDNLRHLFLWDVMFCFWWVINFETSQGNCDGSVLPSSCSATDILRLWARQEASWKAWRSREL